MPKLTVKKKVVEVDGVPHLEIDAHHITLLKIEDLQEKKDKKQKKHDKDESGLKEIDDEIALIKNFKKPKK